MWLVGEDMGKESLLRGSEAVQGKRAKEGPIAARLGRYLLEEEPLKRLRSEQRYKKRIKSGR